MISWPAQYFRMRFWKGEPFVEIARVEFVACGKVGFSVLLAQLSTGIVRVYCAECR